MAFGFRRDATNACGDIHLIQSNTVRVVSGQTSCIILDETQSILSDQAADLAGISSIYAGLGR